MGRTYKNSDKKWEEKAPNTTKIKKKKRGIKRPLSDDYSDEYYYEDLEMEAYDEEFSEKLRRRGSK